MRGSGRNVRSSGCQRQMRRDRRAPLDPLQHHLLGAPTPPPLLLTSFISAATGAMPMFLALKTMSCTVWCCSPGPSPPSESPIPESKGEGSSSASPAGCAGLETAAACSSATGLLSLWASDGGAAAAVAAAEPSSMPPSLADAGATTADSLADAEAAARTGVTVGCSPLGLSWGAEATPSSSLPPPADFCSASGLSSCFPFACSCCCCRLGEGKQDEKHRKKSARCESSALLSTFAKVCHTCPAILSRMPPPSSPYCYHCLWWVESAWSAQLQWLHWAAKMGQVHHSDLPQVLRSCNPFSRCAKGSFKYGMDSGV